MSNWDTTRSLRALASPGGGGAGVSHTSLMSGPARLLVLALPAIAAAALPHFPHLAHASTHHPHAPWALLRFAAYLSAALCLRLHHFPNGLTAPLRFPCPRLEGHRRWQARAAWRPAQILLVPRHLQLLVTSLSSHPASGPPAVVWYRRLIGAEDDTPSENNP